MALSRKPIEIVNQGNHQLLTKAEHWERVPLLDVSAVQNGFAFKSELFTHSEGKPLIRIRDIEDGWTENFYSGDYSDDFVVRKGDILIGMDGDFNAAIWQGADGLLNQRVCRLIPTSKHFSEKYLFLCLQPYLNAINAETSSVTVKHLSSRTIGEIPLPLPPLNEQHRIVAKIEELFSELDKGIENLKTVRAQLKVYRQALLKHAFEGKLTAQWRAENQDKLETADALLKRIQQERAQRYQQQLADWEAASKQGSKPKAPKPLPPLTKEELAKLPELPEDWGWCKWEDILVSEKGAFKRGPFGSALKKEFFVKSGYKVYEQYCPINDDCSFERYYISDEKFRELEGFSVRADDFLVSCSGVTLGRITQVPLNFKEGIINQALLRVRVNKAVYDFKFFKIFFRSRYFQKRIFENSTGTAIPNVKGVNELKAIPLPLCSLLEQQQIISELEARLSEVDQLDQTLTTSLQQAEALRQSILKKAFSGQLVPQDPHDEPASALLARIKAEKMHTREPKTSRSKRNE